MKPLHLIILLLLSFNTKGQIITTFAGNGTWGYSGDGGPATAAQLGDLYQVQVAFDNAGNTYIPMAGSDNVIRKVDAAGTITTFAGNGLLGYTGDGGPAILARLYHPSAMIVDNAGNVIFADQNGAVLRKINTAGIISTMSGPASNTCTGDGNLVSATSFYVIYGLGIDNAGNIYVSDGGCDRIRKISTTGIVTTIAGTGVSGFTGDGGPATAARLGNPTRVSPDNAGNLYFADAQNNRLRKINAAGIITTVAGTGAVGYTGDGGPAINATFRYVSSCCIDGTGNLYIADGNNSVVRKINTAGIVTTFAGNGSSGYSGDGGPATLAQFNVVENVSADASGNIYISDYYNHVIRKVNNCLTANVTLQPSNVVLCSSGNASFSINANNTNAYQWQVNSGTGWTTLSDNTTYSGSHTSSLSIASATATMNNWQYRCALSNACGPIFSIPALLTVNTPASPAIAITTAATIVCSGTSVTFSAAATNGGSTPTYTWKKNGITTGTNTPAYTDNTLSNGDIIACNLVSSNTCVVTNSATSNTLVMSVTALQSPSISIASSAAVVCAGTPVNFTASIVNGGNSPMYQWRKNSTTVSTGSASYSDATLNTSDIITCSLISNASCLISSSAVSNAISINVTPLQTPTVSISTPDMQVCKEGSSTFTAIATNVGMSPTYQWTKNGVTVSAATNTYTLSAPQNSDVVRCILTSNANCLTANTVTSNPISLSLYPTPVVSLDKTMGLCVGSSRILDAGSFASYLWNNNSSGKTLLVNDTGTYFVAVTDRNGCVGSDTTKIALLYPKPVAFLPSDTSICTYESLLIVPKMTFTSYRWNTGVTTPSLNTSKPGVFWLEAMNTNNCTGRDTITILPKECIKGIYFPTAFTPNKDGRNDVFKPLIYGKITTYKFTVYNRWGQVIFQTENSTSGWDGFYKGSLQESNVFIWNCIYQFEGESKMNKSGTLVLVR